MCKAHVLRFRCRHAVLMSLEPCRLGPCPVLKTTGRGLPQQPHRCFNCQSKSSATSPGPGLLTRVSSQSSTSSVDSLESRSSTSSTSFPTNPFLAAQMRTATKALPGVSRQSSFPRAPSINSSKTFTFTCDSSDHSATPHYSDLPSFLPHQDHPCPPCQLENLRTLGDSHAVQAARSEYPNLRSEQLVHGGRTWDPETMKKPSLEKYVEERRCDERQVWLHVTRKWTQDLHKAGVLVSMEDGLGLFA